MGWCFALLAATLGLASPARSELFLVFPFRNLAGPATLDWIGESFAENIRRTLAPRGVRVPSAEERDEAAREFSAAPLARMSRAALVKLAAEAGAARMICGEYEWTAEPDGSSPATGTLRARAWLIDVERLLTVLEAEETGNMTELAVIQARLARRMLCAARPAECPTEEEFLKTDPPVRIDAMESYIRGLLASDTGQKHRLFAQAARLAPDFSEPCFELGRMQWEDGSYRAAAEWLARVSPQNDRWLEANFLLALSRYHTGDYAGAFAAWKHVAEGAATAEVLSNLGVVEFRLGRPEAIVSLEKAIEREPTDADYRFNAGYVLWRQGDLGRAGEHFREVLKLDPEDTEAQRLLERCLANNRPRKGDLGTEGLERLKENYGRLGGPR